MSKINYHYSGETEEVTKAKDLSYLRWREHAKVIKTVDPSAKTIFNCNYLNPSALKSILEGIGSEWVDGAEFHGKWPSGGKSAPTTSLKQWMEEVPLRNHKYNYVWR